MSQKLIWILVLGCCIRGIYANLIAKDYVWFTAFTIIFFFSIYMLADMFGMVPPGTVEALFGQN